MDFNAKTSGRAIIEWIKNYVNNLGKKKVVIGISGGKNSAVTAGLLVEALGKERILGIYLPTSSNTSSQEYQDAMEVAKHLGIHLDKMTIFETFQSISKNLRLSNDGKWEDEFPDTFYSYKANTIARLRMTYLYAFAALYGDCLVVNTSDRSCNVIGYTTKFGDQAGDFSPIGNFTNEEVEALGDYLMLPSRIVHKEATDGLWLTGDSPDETISDETNTGILYSDVNKFIREGRDSVEPEVASKIERAYEASVHKRNLNLPTFDAGLYDFFKEKYGN